VISELLDRRLKIERRIDISVQRVLRWAMGYAKPLGRARSVRLMTALLASALTLVLISRPASAASLAGKDGMIHACFKAKGKAKGTLRVVRSAKAKCPRGWKKTAWSARGPAASGEGEAGSPGGNGEGGTAGTPGATGMTGAKGTVASLEKQVTELLTKVKSLESILSGIDNAQLKSAIGAVPVVQTLCAQAGKLNEQSGKLGDSVQALNGVLGPLLLAFAPVSVPTALPAFACPAL
jgi:hypothetical protein